MWIWINQSCKFKKKTFFFVIILYFFFLQLDRFCPEMSDLNNNYQFTAYYCNFFSTDTKVHPKKTLRKKFLFSLQNYCLYTKTQTHGQSKSFKKNLGMNYLMLSSSFVSLLHTRKTYMKKFSVATDKNVKKWRNAFKKCRLNHVHVQQFNVHVYCICQVYKLLYIYIFTPKDT